MKQFKLEIISPNEIFFEKEIDLVIFPGSEGDFGILKNHMPFLTSLRVGIVYIYLDKKLIETFLYAGKISIELRKKGLINKIKSDNTPVSNGDLEVNKIIIGQSQECILP